MEYSIVTNFRINQSFKSKSKYFKVSLGQVSTTDSNSGDRVYSQKDTFAYFYNTTYKTTIYGQGSIGNIKFYTDHYITEDHIAMYYDKEEFIFDYDEKMVKEKGVDFYLGNLIKTIETEYKHRLEKEEEVKEEIKKQVGDPDKVLNNPGAVTYADLKAYLDKKNSERLKS